MRPADGTNHRRRAGVRAVIEEARIVAEGGRGDRAVEDVVGRTRDFTLLADLELAWDQLIPADHRPVGGGDDRVLGPYGLGVAGIGVLVTDGLGKARVE